MYLEPVSAKLAEMHATAVVQAVHWLAMVIGHIILGTLTYAFSLSGTWAIRSAL